MLRVVLRWYEVFRNFRGIWKFEKRCFSDIARLRTRDEKSPSSETQPICKCWVLLSYFTRHIFYPRVILHGVCYRSGRSAVNETKNRSCAQRHPADRRTYVRNGWNLIYDAIRNDRGTPCVIVITTEITTAACFLTPITGAFRIRLLNCVSDSFLF